MQDIPNKNLFRMFELIFRFDSGYAHICQSDFFFYIYLAIWVRKRHFYMKNTCEEKAAK